MKNKDRKIHWWVPQIGDEEGRLIKQVLENDFPNEGELTVLFENRIAQLLGCKYAVAVTSGTSALFLALKSLGIGPSDEVIVPDVTFIATANAVQMCGARPVLVDVDPGTMNMDPAAFKKAITERTKAVMPVHISGRAADMESVLAIAAKSNIHVVEDAAQALMSKHNGRFLGTFGNAGCFSFSPHKTITTGQGGIVVTDDENLHVRLRELKDQGRPVRGTGGDDLHDTVGYNFKFTDLQAAVGLGQLDHLESRLQRMREINRLYAGELSGLEGISLFPFRIEEGEIPQWTDVIVEDRDGLDKFLESNNVDCRRYWFPIHTQKPYRLDDEGFPNSLRLSARALWLPSAFTLENSDIKEVCSHIRKFLGKS